MQHVLLAGVLILCVLCSVSYSYTYVAIVPAKHGGCYDPDTGILNEVGEYYDMKKCEVHSCGIFNKTHMIIHSIGCGSVGLDKNSFRKCHLERRMDLRYPDCCPRIVCQ